MGIGNEVLAPGQRIVKDVLEDIKQAVGAKDGYLFVRSTTPLFGSLISGISYKTISQFTARATLPGFVPPPLRGTGGIGFAITGSVTDFGTGAPAVGVKITLSREGVSDISTTTDANGGYSFTTLAPGTYTLTPSEKGRAFIPPSATVVLSTGNLAVNFTRGILPIINAITVITNDTDPQRTAGNNPEPFAIFGTVEVKLRIDGVNFVGPQGTQPGQTVYFGSRAIPAQNINVVDSQTLYVRLILNSPEILAELAPKGFYGSYDITIAGQPPFETNRSNALPFYILPPLPVMTGIEPNVATARYEINSVGQALVVAGFGFRAGARLIFQGAPGLTSFELDTTFVNSTQLNAYLPPQALRYGGFYTVRVRNVSILPELSGEAISFQVNNLRPVISYVYPPGPLEIIGPGPTPVSVQLTVNGSNFYPGTILHTAITFKSPEKGPALVAVNGIQQCIVINGQTILRVRVIDENGFPLATFP
jgi:hypothetical protein